MRCCSCPKAAKLQKASVSVKNNLNLGLFLIKMISEDLQYSAQMWTTITVLFVNYNKPGNKALKRIILISRRGRIMRTHTHVCRITYLEGEGCDPVFRRNNFQRLRGCLTFGFDIRAGNLHQKMLIQRIHHLKAT